MINRSIIETSEIVWDDLRFPAQGINPSGLIVPPDVDTSTGMLMFPGNKDAEIGGIAQMPHGWRYESVIYPHLHIICPTANTSDSRWKFEYNIGNPEGSLDLAFGSFNTLSTVTLTNPNDAQKMLVVSFGPLDMTGYFKSACILWKVTRLASSDVLDTDSSSIAMLEFDIHYQIDRRGSQEMD